MSENPTSSRIEFRVLDTLSRKILKDSSAYNATVQRNDGVATVVFNRDGLKELLFTGFKSPAGTKVFEGDIIEALVTTDRGAERMTDLVHFSEGAWRFGTFDGTLADVTIIAVMGNRFEMAWPTERPLPVK